MEFTNWKDATTSIAHEQSQYHIDAVKFMATPRLDVEGVFECYHDFPQEYEENGMKEFEVPSFAVGICSLAFTVSL